MRVIELDFVVAAGDAAEASGDAGAADGDASELHPRSGSARVMAIASRMHSRSMELAPAAWVRPPVEEEEVEREKSSS